MAGVLDSCNIITHILCEYLSQDDVAECLGPGFYLALTLTILISTVIFICGLLSLLAGAIDYYVARILFYLILGLWIVVLCERTLTWLNILNRFPLNVYTRRWTPRFPRPCQLKRIDEESEECEVDALCERCYAALSESKLMFGSWTLSARKSEWCEWHVSIEELRKSARERCHLCALIWSFVDENNREEGDAEQEGGLEVGGEEVGAVSPRIAGDDNIQGSSLRSKDLRIKIWEELSRDTNFWDALPVYLRIYCGTEPISDTLSITRGVINRQQQYNFTTNSAEHILLARSWIQLCQSNHERCNRSLDRDRAPPTRLIWLGGPGSWELVWLHICTEADQGIRYATLSHCWGSTPIFTLNSTNLESMIQGIRLEDLPLNFRHAITIARQLGISYIWIDSLCIMQDSPSDWERESQRMIDIYSSAVVTIASTGSTSASGGCFHRRNPLGHYSLNLPTWLRSGWTIHPKTEDWQSVFADGVDKSALNGRGWVFQERLLSPRILHYASDSLLWECNTMFASEFHAEGVEYLKSRLDRRDGSQYLDSELHERREREDYATMSRIPPPRRLPAPKSIKGKLRRQLLVMQYPQVREAYEDSPRREPKPPKGNTVFDDAWSGFRSSFETLCLSRDELVGDFMYELGFHQRWYDLVRLYSHGQLTRRSDKLIAMAGIARKVKENNNLTYVAGLWREHIALNILWYVENPAKSRFTPRRAPSWSWASLDGLILHAIEPGASGDNARWKEHTFLAEFHNAAVTKDGFEVADTAGTIDGGYLEASGKLQHVSKVENEDGHWILKDDCSRRFAKFFPDTTIEDTCSPFVCLGVIVFERNNQNSVTVRETQGLVLVAQEHDNILTFSCAEACYHRVGLFIANAVSDEGFDPFGNMLDQCPTATMLIV